jgi:hypothetical protein
MLRKLTALLAVAAASLFAGGATPLAAINEDLALTDFEQPAELVHGIPTPGGGSERSMQRTSATEHFPAEIVLYPPSPCRGLAIAWNKKLERFPQASGDDVNKALAAILKNLARHNCAVNVVRDGDISASELLTITPIPPPTQ